jgi:hypothetical protein
MTTSCIEKTVAPATRHKIPGIAFLCPPGPISPGPFPPDPLSPAFTCPDVAKIHARLKPKIGRYPGPAALCTPARIPAMS